MIKFVVLLTSAITFNFTITFSEYLGLTKTIEKDIAIEFTESPIGFESGQPVYPSSTMVFIKANEELDFTISINGGEEIKQKTSSVDISKFIKSQKSTFTVVVDASDENMNNFHQVFGFTTR